MPPGELTEKGTTDAQALADGASHRLLEEGSFLGSSEMLKAPLLPVNVANEQSNSNTDQATRLSNSISRHRCHVSSNSCLVNFFRFLKSIWSLSFVSISNDNTPNSRRPVTSRPRDASASS